MHTRNEGGERYRSSLSLTSALEGIGRQRHVPTDLPPGKCTSTHHRGFGARFNSEKQRNLKPNTLYWPPCSQKDVSSSYDRYFLGLPSGPERVCCREHRCKKELDLEDDEKFTKVFWAIRTNKMDYLLSIDFNN